MILVQTVMEQQNADLEGAGGAGIKLKQLMDDGLLVQAFPVHGPMKAELLETWGDLGLIWPNFHQQPIDVVQDYFGVRIALYFSFVGSMTKAQYPIGIIGAIFYGTSYISDDYKSWASVPFALLMMLWTLALQYSWDRVRLTQVHSWGMIGFSANEDPRPEFSHREFCLKRKAVIRQKGDGSMYKLRMAAGNFAVFVITMVCGLLMIGTLFLEDWLENEYGMGFLAGVVNGIMVPTFTEMFKLLAVALVDWEDHRVQSKYDNVLIAKSFGFQFINSYATIGITAFLKSIQGSDGWFNPCPCAEFTDSDYCADAVMAANGDVTPSGCDCLDNDCVAHAGFLMITILAVAIVVGNVMETVSPMVKAYLKRELEQQMHGSAIDYDGMLERGEMSQAELEAKWEPYGALEAFDDMSEMAVQYGFLSLFAFTCQIAPLLALVNNLIEIRSDAKKLLTVHQRSEAHMAEDLGIWDTIRMLTTVVAMTSNAAYIFFICPTIVAEHDIKFRFWGFFLLEHTALGLYCAMLVAMDFRPHRLKETMDIEVCNQELARQTRAQLAMEQRSGPKLRTIREYQHVRFSAREKEHESGSGFESFPDMMRDHPPPPNFTTLNRKHKTLHEYH